MRFLITFKLVLFCRLFCHSQDNNTEYHSLGKPLKKRSEISKYNDNLLSFKIDFWDIFIGSYCIYGEKNISQKFGLEFGGGITKSTRLNNMFLFETATAGPLIIKPTSATNPSIIAYYDPMNVIAQNIEVVSSSGYSFTLFPKYYFDDDPTNGFHVGVKFIYQHYNFNSNYVSSISRFSTAGNIGYKYQIGNSNFAFEKNIGFGIAFVNDKRNITVKDNNNNEISGQATFSPSRFHINAGIKLSYNFCN